MMAFAAALLVALAGRAAPAAQQPVRIAL